MIEHLLKGVKELGGIVTPTKISGATSFFEEFGQFIFDNNAIEERNNVLTLLPFPEFNLAFPYPIDEIKFALSKSQDQVIKESEAQNLLSTFKLDANLSRRPSTSLSGGEMMLLTLAKAFALEPLINRLILCTPYHFLNQENHFLVDYLTTYYSQKGKDVFILNTENQEINSKSILNNSEFISSVDDLHWSFSLEDLVVEFEETNFPKFSPGKKIKYSNFKASKIKSPTFLKGTNGIGKSVLAKLLSGLIEQKEGSFKIICAGKSGKARLLMQDSTIQLFGNTPIQYIKRVTFLENDSYEGILKIFNRISADLSEYLKNHNILYDADLGNWKTNPSILHAKMVLIAERIFSEPPLLILDEPSFGLSKELSDALLKSICDISHEKNIAVLMITQKENWAYKIFKTEIHLKPNSKEILVELKELENE